MASVFQPKGSRAWNIKFATAPYVYRRVKGFTDKGASEELARKLERLVLLRASGKDPDPTLAKWLREDCPDALRLKLVRFGVLDAREVCAAKPLTEHRNDYKQTLCDKGGNPKHVATVANTDQNHPTGGVGEGTDLPSEIRRAGALELGGKTFAEGEYVGEGRLIHTVTFPFIRRGRRRSRDWVRPSIVCWRIAT